MREFRRWKEYQKENASIRAIHYDMQWSFHQGTFDAEYFYVKRPGGIENALAYGAEGVVWEVVLK